MGSVRTEMMIASEMTGNGDCTSRWAAETTHLLVINSPSIDVNASYLRLKSIVGAIIVRFHNRFIFPSVLP